MGEGGRGEGNAGKDFGKSSVTFEDGRYSVSLPLKEQHELLPDNYDLSLARLNTLVKRLRKTNQSFKSTTELSKNSFTRE